MKKILYIIVALVAIAWYNGEALARHFGGSAVLKMAINEIPSAAIQNTMFSGFVAGGYILIPDFDVYAQKADSYLQRKRFSHTSMTGKEMADAAQYTYHVTGVLVPLELALAQGQLESAFGTRGKSAATNPYNIGENDSGTTVKFKTLRDGIRGYYMVIATKYLKGKSLDELASNFVNTNNKRYATSQNYERKVRHQMKYIKTYISQFRLGSSMTPSILASL